MDKQYTYGIILIAAFIGPLLLSFDKKVAFYKKWKHIFIAMLLPAAFYICWDMYFTANHIWSFNPGYYIRSLQVYNLPLEEILFFFVVPYCCLFIYDCLRVYLPKLQNNKRDEWILKGLAITLLMAGTIFHEKQYTFWTFVFSGCFILLIYSVKKISKTFNATLFIIAYSIILLPFLVVNGYLTSIPVVIYNDQENLDFRIFTIPFEDIFYGLLLILMNVVIYEKLRYRSKKRNHKKLKTNRTPALNL